MLSLLVYNGEMQIVFFYNWYIKWSSVGKMKYVRWNVLSDQRWMKLLIAVHSSLVFYIYLKVENMDKQQRWTVFIANSNFVSDMLRWQQKLKIASNKLSIGNLIHGCSAYDENHLHPYLNCEVCISGSVDFVWWWMKAKRPLMLASIFKCGWRWGGNGW